MYDDVMEMIDREAEGSDSLEVRLFKMEELRFHAE